MKATTQASPVIVSLIDYLIKKHEGQALQAHIKLEEVREYLTPLTTEAGECEYIH